MLYHKTGIGTPHPKVWSPLPPLRHLYKVGLHKEFILALTSLHISQHVWYALYVEWSLLQ